MTVDFRYLEQFANFEKAPGSARDFHLDRMRKLLADFGQPQEGLKLVHVAGSKGKGSTSAFIAGLLADRLNERVGIYASPHVYDYRERIRSAVAGQQGWQDGVFADELYARGLEQIRSYIEEKFTVLHPGEENPTTFELLTLLAFLVFRMQGLSWAVIEVGLGGRLDSTNVITPLLSVITPLEIEHSRYLGDTLTLIAGEKGGIIKEGVPVLVADQDEEAMGVLEEIAGRRRSRLIPVHEFSRENTLFGEQIAAAALPAGYLEHNALMALASLAILEDAGQIPGEDMALRPASLSLRSAAIPGRFEIRTLPPPETGVKESILILDAAHTPRSMGELSKTFNSFLSRRQMPADGRRVCIFSALDDKDHRGMMTRLASMADELVISSTGNFKRSNVHGLFELGKELFPGPVDLIVDPAEALRHARISAAGGVILICGSFYLLGEIYGVLNELELA